MDENKVNKKYVDFIDNLVTQIQPVMPVDINELQKNYLITNIRRASIKMAQSIEENPEFNELKFDKQCFFIQVIAEWSFHKEIDLFRSGIPPKYWKIVMQKIWYAMWEVMFACVKNEAPESVILSLVERFVNRTYGDAVDELRQENVIDEAIELQAKEQSNLVKMAEEYRIESNIKNGVKILIKRFLLAIFISGVVSFAVLKFKTIGLVGIITLLVVYILIPSKR